MVIVERNDTLETFFLLEQCRLEIYETSFENRLELVFDLVEFRFVVSIDCNVESDIEHLFLRLCETVAEFFQILVCEVERWIANKALFFSSHDLTLHFGNFLLERSKHRRSVHRIDRN